MDAGAMVLLAETWKNVPAQRACQRSVVRRTTKHNALYAIEPHNNHANPLTIRFELKKDHCLQDENINRIEHTIARITLSFPRRGALELYLTSPSGTRSMILGKRPHDSSPKGFSNFNFLSVHFWDEDPIGTWKLQIVNTAGLNSAARGKYCKYKHDHF